MRLILAIFFTALIFTTSSCKKDYACYGSETMEYVLSIDSTNTNSAITTERKFEVFEACINCGKKDKDNLLQIILEYIVRQEESAKEEYENDGYYVLKENFVNNELICEEQK